MYAELVRRAGELLALGETVVLDASWNAARHRGLAAAVAEQTCSSLVAVRCLAAKTTAAQRITTWTGALSDATPEIAHRMAADADPWPEAHPLPTTGTPAESLARAVACLTSGHRKSPHRRHSGPPGGEHRGAKVEQADTPDDEESR